MTTILLRKLIRNIILESGSTRIAREEKKKILELLDNPQFFQIHKRGYEINNPDSTNADLAFSVLEMYGDISRTIPRLINTRVKNRKLLKRENGRLAGIIKSWLASENIDVTNISNFNDQGIRISIDGQTEVQLLKDIEGLEMLSGTSVPGEYSISCWLDPYASQMKLTLEVKLGIHHNISDDGKNKGDIQRWPADLSEYEFGKFQQLWNPKRGRYHDSHPPVPLDYNGAVDFIKSVISFIENEGKTELSPLTNEPGVTRIPVKPPSYDDEPAASWQTIGGTEVWARNPNKK